MFRFYNIKAVWVLAFMLIFTACQTEQNEIESTASTETTQQELEPEPVISPVPGGNLNLPMHSPKTLNPLANGDQSVDSILKLIFEPLIALDEEHRPVANIASSWLYSDDGRTMNITLRPDIIWHDGTYLTADDVIYSLDTIKRTGSEGFYNTCGQSIASYRQVGNLEVSITFRDTGVNNLYCLTFPVIPRAHYSEAGNDMLPVGNGLFQFDSFQTMKQLKLKKFSSFKGTPYIDEVTAVIIGDKSTELYAFDQGLIDVVDTEITEIGKYGISKDIRLNEYTSGYFDFIGFNFNKTFLQDKALRQAIAYALPKEDIIDSIYLGYATAATNPVNPASWLYSETTEYTYDKTKACQTLLSAGYANEDGDGLLNSKNEFQDNNLQLNILVNEENTERRQIAARLKDELKDIQIEAIIWEVPYESYLEKLQTGDFDIFIGGIEFSLFPDLQFFLHSSSVGGSNYMRYRSDALDLLLQEASQAVGEAAALKAYQRVQEHIVEELPVISIVYRKSVLASGSYLHGDILPALDNKYYTIGQWFLYQKPDKTEAHEGQGMETEE